MAPASVYELRYKLAEAYATRDLAVLTELEIRRPRDSVAAEIVRQPKKG